MSHFIPHLLPLLIFLKMTDLFRISNVEAPTEGKLDKWGFTIKPTITDTELILMCLRNAPCGADKKQAERLIKYYEQNPG